MKFALLFLAFIALPSLLLGADWHRSFDAAQREARQKNRPVLLYFTADWCGFCKRLERQALHTRKFDGYARDRLVLFKADFTDRNPRGPIGHQNRRLAEKFAVQGYPTLILLRPDGSYAGDVNYRRGGADALIRQIDGLRKENRRSHRHRR